MEIKKLIIGIRTASKMFRIQSVGGVILDNVLSLRGKNGLVDEYFKEISISTDRFQYVLKNETLGNTLHMDTDGIVFTKDYYDKDAKVNMDKFISEFTVIWETINNGLKIEDIRRIGIACEHQISTKDNPNAKHMVETFTKFSQPKHQGKFILRFEERKETSEGFAPDIHKSDFLNILYDYYDGESDIEHSKKNTLNANLDVQRYFAPLLKKGCADEVTKLKRIFDAEHTKMKDKLKGMGVLANG